MNARSRLRRLEAIVNDRNQRVWVIYPNGGRSDGWLTAPPPEAHPDGLGSEMTERRGSADFETADDGLIVQL